MNALSFSELAGYLGTAFAETFLMCGIAVGLSILIGIPLGLFIFITSRGLFSSNRILNFIGGFLVNVIRSTPFVILLVLLIPFTRLVAGTSIGPVAASVPLSIAAIAFYARLVESSLHEVDKGVIEAATAIGASNYKIIKDVLLSESLGGLIRGLTVTTICLIGYSAMAGVVGGGGIGDLAFRFGYLRYQTDVMLVSVVLLILLVQAIQSAGDWIAKKAEKK
jgi:D-methionine transport system permease protein